MNQNNSSGKNNHSKGVNNNNNNNNASKGSKNTQNSNTSTNNSDNDSFCKFCKAKVCFKANCYKLQGLPKNKNVPNSKNVNFNALESGNNSLNSFELVNPVSRVPVALKQTLNILHLEELDENVLNNLSMCHSKYLSPSDEGVILIDTGSINSENIEIVFDSGCFKSVIPQSFVNKSRLKCITYRNCGFVANDVKIDIFGATINTPFRYKNTLTNMSFVILPRHNVLLGMDWLALNNATINFGTRTIVFKDDPAIIHNIKNESVESDLKQPCLNTLDHANDELYNPIAESGSNFSNSIKIKPSFDDVDNDLKDPKDINKILTKNTALFITSTVKETCNINAIPRYHVKQNAKMLEEKQKDRRLVLNVKPVIKDILCLDSIRHLLTKHRLRWYLRAFIVNLYIVQGFYIPMRTLSVEYILMHPKGPYRQKKIHLNLKNLL